MMMMTTTTTRSIRCRAWTTGRRRPPSRGGRPSRGPTSPCGRPRRRNGTRWREKPRPTDGRRRRPRRRSSRCASTSARPCDNVKLLSPPPRRRRDDAPVIAPTRWRSAYPCEDTRSTFGLVLLTPPSSPPRHSYPRARTRSWARGRRAPSRCRSGSPRGSGGAPAPARPPRRSPPWSFW